MLTADQIKNCACILLATTGNWTPSDGTASTLSDARAMLAALIYASGGKGFPGPATDDPVKQPAWQACAAAAQAAAAGEDGEPRAPLGQYVVFWAADPANPAKLGPGLNLNWPMQPDSHIIRVSGPILDKDDPNPKRLFFFDMINEAAAIQMDADSGQGFSPRATNKPATSAAVAPAQSAVGVTSPAKRPWLATALFILWVLSGSVLAYWLLQTGGVMRNAVQNFRQAAPQCLAIPAGQKKPAWDAACDTAWQTVWKKLYPDAEVANAATTETKSTEAKKPEVKSSAAKLAGMIDSFRSMVGGVLWTEDGRLSLYIPFVLTMLSIVVLLLAAGLARKGLWFGVLIDDRNRISMSRTQQVAWTALLIGSMAIMGWFNATGVSLIDQSARSAWEVFPYMPAALWAALGINLVATPYLSDVILNRKDPSKNAEPGSPTPSDAAQNPPPQPPPGVIVRQLVTPARLDKNPNPRQAGWIDLITGETEGSDQTLDVSRIQHLVISGTLLTTYFMALADALGDLGGASMISAIATNQSVFTNMPGVGNGTFLGLLGISHAGYLVFKANSSEGKGTPK